MPCWCEKGYHSFQVPEPCVNRLGTETAAQCPSKSPRVRKRPGRSLTAPRSRVAEPRADAGEILDAPARSVSKPLYIGREYVRYPIFPDGRGYSKPQGYIWVNPFYRTGDTVESECEFLCEACVKSSAREALSEAHVSTAILG